MTDLFCKESRSRHWNLESPSQSRVVESRLRLWKYYRYHILWPTKGSGTEDKSFAEKSGNYVHRPIAKDTWLLGV